MNRKKILSLILALAMMFTFVSCSTEKKSVSEKTPYDYGMEVIALMSEAAGTEAYLAAMGGSEVVQEMAGKVAQDFSTDSVEEIQELFPDYGVVAEQIK